MCSNWLRLNPPQPMPEREKKQRHQNQAIDQSYSSSESGYLVLIELGFPKSVPAPPNDKPPNSPSLPEAILNPESLEVLKKLMQLLKS